MTRENKLALVVGFGLILFVGILISDHFSTVRSQRAAVLFGHDGAVDPLALRQSDDSFVDLQKAAPPVPPPIAANSVALGNISAPMSDGQAGGQPAQFDALHVDQPANGETAIAAKPAEQLPEGFVKSPAEGAPIPVNVRYHEVRSGDSLYAICKQYYHDPTLLNALAKFNSVEDAANLKVGMRLLIPPAEAIGGKAAASAVTKVTAVPAAEEPAPNIHVRVEQSTTIKLPMKGLKSSSASTPSTPPSRVTYIVKAGDSLRQIALRIYGSKENWKRIQELNKDVIDDPDNLKVGTVLKL